MTRKPFTTTTWADLEGTGLVPDCRQRPGWGWSTQVDLAHELIEKLPHLDGGTARVLIDAVTAQLPVTLTWTTREASDDTIRTTTATVIVTQIIPPHEPAKGTPGHLRVRYWGFGHDVHLTDVVEADAPKTDYSWAPREDHASATERTLVGLIEEGIIDKRSALTALGVSTVEEA